jgi:S1 RNA binding domain protein
MAVEVGSILEGKVTGITRFGAFVQLENGETGLVHISEVADVYVKDVNDFVKENDTVRVKVLNVSPGKVGLSIRQADPNYQERSRAPRAPRAPRGGRGGGRMGEVSFEDKLARFMKDSEEKQSDLRRSQDSKRGGRGGKARDF